MSNQFQVIPRIQVVGRQAVVYGSYECFQTRTKAQIQNEENLARGKFNGYMSQKTKAKVRKYLSVWIESVERLKKANKYKNLESKPYLTFLTLTLASKQKHTDNEIKRKLLTPFIQECQTKYKVNNYFWRAEAQKNGNIHFHLLVDRYIDKDVIRQHWNRKQNLLKYVDEFQIKHGHSNPNGTDIRKLYDKNSVSAYVLKYVSKTDGARPIKGRIHGCSDAVRNMKAFDITLDNNSRYFAKCLYNDKSIKVMNDVGFTVFAGNILKVMETRANHIYQQYNQNLEFTALRSYYPNNMNLPENQPKSQNQDTIKKAPDNKIRTEQLGIFKNGVGHRDSIHVPKKHQQFKHKPII